jgi:hypothetical protein
MGIDIFDDVGMGRQIADVKWVGEDKDDVWFFGDVKLHGAAGPAGVVGKELELGEF